MAEAKAIFNMSEDELLLRACECWHMAVEHIRDRDYSAATRCVKMANLYMTRFGQLQNDGGDGE